MAGIGTSTKVQGSSVPRIQVRESEKAKTTEEADPPVRWETTWGGMIVNLTWHSVQMGWSHDKVGPNQI